MQNANKLSKFKNDLFYAVLAQGASLVLNLILTLLASKILGVRSFGYWQLFIFYAVYVGFTQVGLTEGVYLRLGGSNYEDIDASVLKSQMWILVVLQVLVGVGISLLCFLFEQNPDRQFIWYVYSFYIIVFNASFYFGYIFQAANRTRVFSVSIILDKLSFIVFVVVLIAANITDYRYYVVGYTATKVLSLFYVMVVGKKIVFAHSCDMRTAMNEAKNNIAVGIKLIAAQTASLFIVGSARLIVDIRWDIEIFAKISFALAITNIVITFLSQISTVLFPALRQVDNRNLKSFYNDIREGTNILLFTSYLFYLPAKIILSLWLPQYKESFIYLGLLLPICVFDGKMQVVGNTYMKVLRKERMLLFLNLASVAGSLLLCYLGAFVFNSIYAIIIFIFMVLAVRGVVAELYLAGVMHFSAKKEILSEILLSVLFVTMSILTTDSITFGVYLAAYLGYCILNRKTIMNLLIKLKGVMRNDKEDRIS